MALVSEWPGKEAFRTRQRLFDNALKAHCRQEFDLSIHALLPQVEGVMSDWLWQNYADRDIPWRMESKTKKLHQILLEIIAAEPEASQEKIIASTFEFVINVVLKNFKWTTGDAPVELTFPGRHPVGHGRYLDQLYSEENSIKLFLLLDTIRRLI